MAEPLQGVGAFPGINWVKSAQYALQHGITPGVITFTITPQPTLPVRDGPVTFQFGNVRLVFEDCRVDFLSAQRNDQGEIWTFHLFDRRWKWAFGYISGHYNLRLDDGEVDPELEKTPQQLAALCLEAMGERLGTFDVRDIPNIGRPEVQWDFENPAQALAALCESLGCRVVLQIDGRVKICRLGVGGTLPFDEDVVNSTASFNPPERPDSLLFVAGPSSFQVDLVLFPVGEDIDGSIVPINDLSYKPVGGWQTCNPPWFSNVTTDRGQRLAKKTVFRWYQVDATKNPDGTGPPLVIPGYGAITWLEQILPLDPILNETVDPVEGEEPLFIEGAIFGTYWDEKGSDQDTPPRTVYARAYSIDAAQGIVEFANPVFRLVDVGPAGKLPQPAVLYLRCTVQVHDVNTWEIHHDKWFRHYPPPLTGTKERVIRSDDVYLRVIPEYDPQTYRMLRTTDNADELERESAYRFAAADQEYQSNAPQEVTYRGLRLFNPDGAIQSVTWSVSDEAPGAQTRVARHDEFAVVGLDYKERRRLERISKQQMTKMQEEQQALKELADLHRIARRILHG